MKKVGNTVSNEIYEATLSEKVTFTKIDPKADKYVPYLLSQCAI